MTGWLWGVIGAFAALALAALVWLVVWLVQRQRTRRSRSAWSSAGANRGAQDIERLFRGAEEKLRKSDLRSSSIRDLPVYLLVGDHNAGKTSLILNSGLQSDLLAGQNRQGVPVDSTETLNIWLINGCIVIDAPAHIWKDDSLATALLRRLRYPALEMAFSRRRSAHRAAIACISAAQLGSGAGLDITVSHLNKFLLLASQQLGIALPVYAVLTKADTIRGFRELFFNLKPEESAEVMGMSLDADQLADRATYAEIARSTLDIACRKLAAFLQTRRTSLLAREYKIERTWAGFEFPRRLERVRGSLVSALTKLCNPSLIQTSPVLRGFYFTGVRRSIRQAGDSTTFPAAPGDFNDSLNATRMFRPGADSGKPAARPPDAQEVDEWAFSRRLLRDVVFADSAAKSVSGRTHFRDVYRAALCWAAAGVSMFLIIGEMVSYARNTSLERSLVASGSELVQASSPMQTLSELDKYREPVDRLIEYRDHVPMSLRWGLYQGAALLPAAQQQYCTAARRVLVDPTLLSIERRLRKGKTTADYDSLYRMLKAELMMSGERKRAEPEFLAGELAGLAIEDGRIAPGSAGAVEPLLRTYARLVTIPAPEEYCLVQADAAVIRTARADLREASAEDKIYSDLLSKAGRGIPPVDYNKIHPNDAVHNSYIVPGAFTAAAWGRMQKFFDQPDKLISTETWVLGETNAAPVDPRILSDRLRNRYANDFAGKWREYLNQGTVAHFSSLDDAAKKLDLITSGNQSALLWLFSVAAEQTSPGEPVTARFQPVREVVPKAGDFSAGEAYLKKLIDLQVLLSNAAHLSGPAREQAINQIRTAATEARKNVGDTAFKFRTDIGPRVKTLLLQPIVEAEDLVNAQGAADLASASAGLCAPYQAVYAKFPFQADAIADADPEQALALLKPAEGPVWRFYSANLTDSLDQGALGFTPKFNPAIQLRPDFILFMNRVLSQSRIFYATPDDPGFRLGLTLRPETNGSVHAIDIYVDDQHYPLSPGASTTINWSLRRSHRLRIEFQFAGVQEPPQTLTGPWALLRWLSSAENPSAQPLSWILRSGRLVRQLENGAPMTYRLDVQFADGSPFDMRKLAGVRCVGAAK